MGGESDVAARPNSSSLTKSQDNFRGLITDLTEIEDLSIQQILSALQHSNNMNRPIVVERLARVLYKSLLNSEKSRQVLLSSGGVDTLLKNVSSSLHSNPSLEAVLLCLGVISWRSVTGRKELSGEHNLEILATHMKQSATDNIYRKVASIMANVAVDTKAAETMIERTNVTSGLMDGFVNRSTHCRNACAWAMRNISRCTPGPAALVEQGALMYFSEVVKSPHTYPHQTREHVAGILANIAISHDTHFGMVKRCLDGVVNQIKSSTLVEEVKGYVRAVANLATNEDARPALLLLNAPQILLKHLVDQHPVIYAEIKCDVCRGIGNVCLSEEGQDVVSENDGVGILVDALVKAILTEENDAIADTLWAISSLCRGRESDQADLVAHAGLHKIIEASKLEDTTVQYFAARCLEVFSEFSTIQQHLIEQHGLGALSALSHVSDSLVRQGAKRALYLLAHTNRGMDQSRATMSPKTRSQDMGSPPPPPPEAISGINTRGAGVDDRSTHESKPGRSSLGAIGKNNYLTPGRESNATNTPVNIRHHDGPVTGKIL